MSDLIHRLGPSGKVMRSWLRGMGIYSTEETAFHISTRHLSTPEIEVEIMKLIRDERSNLI